MPVRGVTLIQMASPGGFLLGQKKAKRHKRLSVKKAGRKSWEEVRDRDLEVPGPKKAGEGGEGQGFNKERGGGRRKGGGKTRREDTLKTTEKDAS